MTEQSRFNDSPSEDELIFVLPWTCSLQVGKRVGALAAGKREEEAASSSKQAASSSGLLGLEPEGREEGVSEMQQLSRCTSTKLSR
jgi:hypothetical protein